MRQKAHVAAGCTDRELFCSLELGDMWPDAELAELWAYLYGNKKLSVPPSWQATMAHFNQELASSAP